MRFYDFLLGMTLNPTSKGGCEETLGNTKECGCLLGGKPGLYPILWVCPPPKMKFSQ